ncbi:hypothetical protein ACFE04_015349 [Oxalis oulophora]
MASSKSNNEDDNNNNNSDDDDDDVTHESPLPQQQQHIPRGLQQILAPPQNDFQGFQESLLPLQPLLLSPPLPRTFHRLQLNPPHSVPFFAKLSDYSFAALYADATTNPIDATGENLVQETEAANNFLELPMSGGDDDDVVLDGITENFNDFRAIRPRRRSSMHYRDPPQLPFLTTMDPFGSLRFSYTRHPKYGGGMVMRMEMINTDRIVRRRHSTDGVTRMYIDRSFDYGLENRIAENGVDDHDGEGVRENSQNTVAADSEDGRGLVRRRHSTDGVIRRMDIDRNSGDGIENSRIAENGVDLDIGEDETENSQCTIAENDIDKYSDDGVENRIAESDHGGEGGTENLQNMIIENVISRNWENEEKNNTIAENNGEDRRGNSQNTIAENNGEDRRGNSQNTIAENDDDHDPDPDGENERESLQNTIVGNVDHGTEDETKNSQSRIVKNVDHDGVSVDETENSQTTIAENDDHDPDCNEDETENSIAENDIGRNSDKEEENKTIAENDDHGEDDTENSHRPVSENVDHDREDERQNSIAEKTVMILMARIR